MPSTRALSLGVIALTLALAYGIWYAYSVILVALLAEFGWSRSVLAGAFSVFTVVHGASGPVIGTLCARFRPMRVTTAGGVAMGITLFADSFISTPVQLYLALAWSPRSPWPRRAGCRRWCMCSASSRTG